ncbi:MAG TPA: DUF721 domain-containing protein [Polyangia bacterium]
MKAKPQPPERKYDKPWKPWRPKHREHLGPPQTTGDLMGQVLARLGGQGRALEFRVFDCYARIVGDLLRARTAPERMAGTTLFVRVASSALAHEVTLMRGEIVAKLNAELGAGTVVELRTRVGKVGVEPKQAAPKS